MRAVPLFSLKAMFKDWVFEFDCWFWEFETWPLSVFLDKMIWMLKKPHWPQDREDGSLIGGKLMPRKKEIYKIATNGRMDYVIVDKKWLFVTF